MPGRPVPTMCVGVGAPPYCFVLAVGFCGRFNISLRFMAHLLRKYVIAPTGVQENSFVCANPKDRANNVTAGCKHTPLRSVASLLRKHCPRPTNVDQYSACSQNIVRTTMPCGVWNLGRCLPPKSSLTNKTPSERVLLNTSSSEGDIIHFCVSSGYEISPF